MNSEIMRLLFFIGISVVQWGFGYIQNKWLGFIIPIAFLGYLSVTILPLINSHSVGRIILLFLLVLLLCGIFYGSWKSGEDQKKKHIKRGLEKMEARDLKK